MAPKTMELPSGTSSLRLYTVRFLNLAPNSDKLSLHLYLICRQLDRGISRVRRLQHNRGALAMEMLERGAAASNQSTHHRAIPEPLWIDHGLHQHHIAIRDVAH